MKCKSCMSTIEKKEIAELLSDLIEARQVNLESVFDEEEDDECCGQKKSFCKEEIIEAIESLVEEVEEAEELKATADSLAEDVENLRKHILYSLNRLQRLAGIEETE